MNQNSSNQEIVVSISCTTYNHANYIRQCLDGFLMQQTNFPFEILIHDDASTDGTQDIIREYEARYPGIIKPLYEEENQYQNGKPAGMAVWNYPRARGKYIALCEGDDYWTDPLKLQKQVDFLENNQAYGCVYTAYKTVDVNSEDCDFPASKEHMGRSFSGDIFDALLHGNFPQTLTILFRKQLLKLEITPPYNFDYTLFLTLALQSKFHYLPEVTGAYRINPNGLIQTRALAKYDWDAIPLFFYKEYLKNKKFKRPFKEHFRIQRTFYTRLCGYKNFKNHKSYFKEIAAATPLLVSCFPLSFLINHFGRRLRLIK